MVSSEASPSEKQPFVHGAHTATGVTNLDWWPNTLDLDILHQHDAKTDPMDQGFDYREAVKTLDFDALKQDLYALMTDSQAWWRRDRQPALRAAELVA